MKYSNSSLKDVLWVQPELIKDERGFFARAFCYDEFVINHNINMRVAQANISHNDKIQTLRGMHFQKTPYQEDKYITCTHGSIQDVIIDLRKDSPTYLRWDSFILSRENRQWLLIPKGFAHGYLTLEDDTDVFYMVSQFYTKGAEAGIRWDDRKFDIHWVKEPLIISEKDKTHLDFEEE